MFAVISDPLESISEVVAHTQVRRIVILCISCDFDKMQARAKFDQRIEIRFLCRQGYTPTMIRNALNAVHGDESLSKSSVQRWFQRFQNEGDDPRDKPKTGAPVIRTRKIAAVQQVLDQDRRASVRQIARQVKLSVGSTHKLLKKDMKLVKKSAKWIPHLLTAPQKVRRMDLARWSLAAFRMTRQHQGYQRVIAEDESWFLTWDPDSREASRQWLRAADPRPTKVRTEMSNPKVMLVVFIDREGLIYREFIPNGCGIGCILYQQILERFRQALRRRRPALWRHELKWCLLQDGAPAHRADSTARYLRYHEVDTLPHPGYSPDLNPCDYWFFARVKSQVKGRRFRTIPELQDAVDEAIAQIPSADFAKAFDHLTDRLQKCVDKHGDYFEGH